MATESCPKCVLLIEDDQSLRDAIAAFLEDRGYTTIGAEDVHRAIELLGKADFVRPCLVLADFISLRVDWPALLGALHPDDQLATLPMALVSVRSTGYSVERVKRPTDFDLLARIVGGHCCGGDRAGGKAKDGRSSLSGPV